MIDVIYRKNYLIPIEHIWFSDDIIKGKSDIIYYHGISNFSDVTCKHNIYCRKQHTLVTDLLKEKEDLWQLIRKKIRYEIRKSENDDIICRYYDYKSINNEIITMFMRVYNQMYISKGINVKFNTSLVNAYIRCKAIMFTIGYYNNIPQVFHSYILDNTNARFFYSASLFREDGADQALIARINKYLHWSDICYFKDIGLVKYDWGGIMNPLHPSGIDNFKIGFGGTQATYYNVIVFSTMYNLLYKLFKH